MNFTKKYLMRKYKFISRPLFVSLVSLTGVFQPLILDKPKIYGQSAEPQGAGGKSSIVLPDLNKILQAHTKEKGLLKETGELQSELDANGGLKSGEDFFYPMPSLSIKHGPTEHQETAKSAPAEENKPISINFNNVSMIEYIRYVSRISNRNFIFDENDLQFNVTIISEEPVTIDNIITALLQELRIRELSLIEQDNNFIIHKNPKVNSISQVVSDVVPPSDQESSIVTQVFHLNTLPPEKASIILRPLVSDNALVEVIPNTNHLIVTDLTSNVRKIAQLIKSIDAPDSGLVIGQYVSRLRPIEILIPLAQQIMDPISQNQTLTFIPHLATNSIFIVAAPFLVERTIAILQYLDQEQGETQILNLRDLKIKNIPGRGGAVPGGLPGAGLPAAAGGGAAQANPLQTPGGTWLQDENGRWYFKPNVPSGGSTENPPTGIWKENENKNWEFVPGKENEVVRGSQEGNQPKGHWVQDKDGNWIYVLDALETFQPGEFNRQFEGSPVLAGGVKKETKFYIYKLKYRQGDSIEPILRQISDTLQQNEKGNEDFINALRSVQWLSTPNSLVFSGTVDALEKVRALVLEIDIPVRQVFVEMLILETSLTDSLQYGVSYGTRFGGGDLTGAQGFLSGQGPLVAALATAGFSGLGQAATAVTQLIPNGTDLANTVGFNLGVIGRKITHCGTEFGSIGALVNALHDRSMDKVVSNPKLLIEDNATAEIFVGLNTPYRTQSISNDIGSVITSNFEYVDVGTHLTVTPYIGNGDIIALNIAEEVSSIVAGLITDASTASTSPGPTTRIHRTTTRVHIPDTYFLIISGLMQDEEVRDRNQVPCLGAVPLLGAGFSAKNNSDTKRNLMIFIRPKIINTEEEINNLTKHQQDIYDYKNTLMNSDDYEVREALDLFNISQTWHPEDEPYDDDTGR